MARLSGDLEDAVELLMVGFFFGSRGGTKGRGEEWGNVRIPFGKIGEPNRED